MPIKGSTMSKTPTILFVEDDEVFRYAACRQLQTDGYAVIEVPSSMDALRAIEKGAIDVAVIDIALYPKEPHGIALARMIRNNQPGVGILFVTGVEDVEKLDPGIPGEILYKPVELAVLSQKVHDLLAQEGSREHL